MTLPNFLVIGAGKSGTSSLYRYLGQHPQIYMSPLKEPRFFAFEGQKLDFRGPGDKEGLRSSVVDIESYRRLFDGVSGEKAIGEASPLYMYSPKVIERIEHYIPETKLIAILRDPAERAYSAFLHMVRDGREPLDDFAEALREEEARVKRNYAPGWRYKEGGFYYAQLSRYFERFGKEQIRVFLYEDLKTDPAVLLRDVFEFLGVDDGFVPNMSTRYNVSGVPRNKNWHTFLTKPNPIKASMKPFVSARLRRRLKHGLKNRNLDEPPQLSPETRRQLIEVYREDVSRLQDLIQRDLSHWLE